MNIVDLVLIIFLSISIFIGYKKGTLKEIYDLIALAITLLFSFLLMNKVSIYMYKNIDIRSIFNIKMEDNMYEMLISFIGPLIGFTIVFIIVWLILKITIFVLIRNIRIPERTIRHNWIGSVIAAAKTIFFFTVIAFTLSFSFLTNYSTLYEDSLFSKPLLKMNPPLYNSRNNIVKIYDDIQTLNKIMQTQGSLTDSTEIVDLIKSIKENPIINDKMIIEVSKTTINNKTEIDLTNFDVDQFRINLQKDEKYPLLKTLYDEKIITDDLVIKVLEANNVNGLTEEDIKNIFK